MKRNKTTLNKHTVIPDLFRSLGHVIALPALAMICTLTSCSDWTSTESVGISTSRPWEREPGLWDEYKTSIREYKLGSHYMVYARFENSPEKPSGEQCFMRSLPDSLDIVSLVNADNFSRYDAEDMAWMKSVGTKVLYQVDFASRSEELSEESALSAYLDKVIASVNANGLDGYSFTGIPKSGNASVQTLSQKIVEKLSAAKTEDQLLVFEGNPAFVTAADLPKVDFFVLATETVENDYDLRNTISDATDYGVPQDRMLLAVSLSGTYYDESNASTDVLSAMTDNVISCGPLAGLALYGIESDYYHYEGNYISVRSVIERLNPSR